MRLRRILVAAAIVVVALVAVSAATACNPGRTNDHNHYWDGWTLADFQTSHACLFGSEASLYVTNPTVVASGSTSFSAAYTGVQFEDAQANFVFGQMGWENLYGGGGENFAAINAGGGNWKEGDFTRPINGSVNQYEVTYSHSNNTFHFYYNQTNYYNWQYTPKQLGCDYITIGKTESEISTLANQMPGTSVNKEYFEYDWLMDNGGTWFFPSNWTSENTGGSGHFGNEQVQYNGGKYLNTWDKCS